jgi:nucleotide-binding universal stress UspA family protein
MGSDEYPTKGIDLQAIREPLFKASRKYLADMESRLVSEGMKVKAESLEGNRPADTITEYAQKEGIHQSHIPVLLIRPESCRP